MRKKLISIEETSSPSGIILSQFDGSQWDRDFVSSREELANWMIKNDFHDIEISLYFH